jgi:Protein of unknown function (DUF1236)
MTNRFMMSVAAAALIAGTGFANAQGTGTAAPSGGSTVQQSAPSAGTSATTPSRDAAEPTKPSSGMKATQTEQKSPAAGKNERAEDNMQGQKSKGMSSEMKDNAKGGSKDMKAEGRDSKTGNTNADSKTGTDSKTGNMNADSKSGNMNAQTKGATDSKSQTTTGNAATTATAAPPAEKRTQIVSAIKSEKVEEVTNVNFNISVGATIPATVRFHRLPSRIVEIYPEWRGYEFILVHGRYIIVRPQTHEIIYIIEG